MAASVPGVLRGHWHRGARLGRRQAILPAVDELPCRGNRTRTAGAATGADDARAGSATCPTNASYGGGAGRCAAERVAARTVCRWRLEDRPVPVRGPCCRI